MRLCFADDYGKESDDVVGSNPYLKFLTFYGRSAENEAAFDESLRAAARELKVNPPTFDHPLRDRIVRYLGDTQPPSIVLTGGAGDGKTHLCREVYGQLSGRPDGWDSTSPSQALDLPAGRTLRIVKDFTELGVADQYDLLNELTDTIFSPSMKSPVFLIAANEGIITRKASGEIPNSAEQRLAQKHQGKLARLSDLLERMLTGGMERAPDAEPFYLFDLSRVPAADTLRLVLHSVTEHEGWKFCNDCPSKSPDSGPRCLLYENRERLRQPLIQERLKELVQMLDYNSEHLTIRHLLMLVANAITGHADADGDTPMVSDCAELAKPPFSGASRTRGAYFQNLFGLNVRRRKKSKPFSSLSRLGVGEESSNRMDKLLAYGDIDDDYKHDFDSLIRGEAYFVDVTKYMELLRGYRERDPKNEESSVSFMDELTAQRRRLYFELPTELEEKYRHPELVRFHSAAEFRRKVVAPLLNNGGVSRTVIQRLIKGLNRTFVGGLTEAHDKLYLTTSGTTSQERISDVLIFSLPQDQLAPDDTGVSIAARSTLHMGGFGVDLMVHHRGNRLGRLPLTLSRYEFLSRVADGVLPVSFSAQLYEDILVFKSQILQAFERSYDTSSLPLTLLRVMPDGQIQETTLQLDDERSYD